MHPVAMPRRVVLAVSVAVLIPAVAACGSSESGSGTTTSAAAPGDGTIVAEGFALSDVTVAPGADLELLNRDGTEHTATADDGSFELRASAGTSDGPVAAPDEPGEHPFHCEIHPNMQAVVTVAG